MPLPRPAPGMVIRCAYLWSDEADAGRSEGAKAETCEFGGSEMTDALILYCGAHHIPLPSAGVKALQRFGDSLLLIVTLNLTGAGWPLSAGLAIQRPKAVPVMELAAAGD